MCFNSFVYRKKTGFTLDFCQKLSFVIPESGKLFPEQTFERLFWQDESGKLCVLFRLFCRTDFLWNQVFHRFNAALWKIRSLYGFKIRLLQRSFSKMLRKNRPQNENRTAFPETDPFNYCRFFYVDYHRIFISPHMRVFENPQLLSLSTKRDAYCARRAWNTEVFLRFSPGIYFLANHSAI